MVATQSFSISRRTLDVEDYIDIVRRHAGWIVGPAFLGLVVSVCVAFMLPNEYMSKATMQITPAQISDMVVQTTISNSLNERIQQMQTQILSRTELSNIIQDPRLDLYSTERKTKPLEDVIEDMKRAINIQFVSLPGALSKRASAFDISFSYKDRYKAQLTVQALMNKFDEENQNTQKTDQDAVTGFVGDMLNSAKASLQEADDKLTAFKEGNAGKLPENVQLNIARENGYREKIRSDEDQIFRDEQAQSQLETNKDAAKARLDFLVEEQSQMASLMPGLPGSPAAQQNQELASLDKTIDSMEFQLQDLQKRFSPKYPGVINAEKQLASYKTKREQLAKQVQAKAQEDSARVEADAAKPKQAAMTQASLKEEQVRHAVDEEINNYNAQEKLLRQHIEKLRGEEDSYKKESDSTEQMLKDSTGLEAQYEELNQNKKMAESNYLDLQKKQQLAQENSQLIQRKAGEVLDVLDTASLPVAPTKPNRYMIVGAGFAMSMVLGLGMAGLQEAKDTSLKNLKDVRAYTNLPVLCSIPLLENTMLVKRKRRLTYLFWAAAVLVGTAMVSGAVVYYETITLKG
jgi:uncharacterized protein involved in exopolysaccharide biosynthesis